MAPIGKRRPRQWQAQVGKTGHPTQTRNFETRAEAESTALRDALARYLEEVTPLKKGVEPETNRPRGHAPSPRPPRRRRISPPSGRPRERRLLQGEARLAEVCHEARNPWLPPLVQRAVETPMRQSALLRVRWEHVELAGRTACLPDSAEFGDSNCISIRLSSDCRRDSDIQ